MYIGFPCILANSALFSKAINSGIQKSNTSCSTRGRQNKMLHRSWPSSLLKKLNKQPKTSLSAHIRQGLVPSSWWIEPILSALPALWSPRLTSWLDGELPFHFLSCRAGFGTSLANGQWRGVAYWKICYNQRHSRRYVNRSASEEDLQTHKILHTSFAYLESAPRRVLEPSSKAYF